MTPTLKTWGGIDFVRVPQGKFLMGSSDDTPHIWDDEKPQHTFDIPYDYWVARFPVTNALFERFVQAEGFTTQAEKNGWAYVFNVAEREWQRVDGANWRRPTGPHSEARGLPNHPVVNVCFYDALAFIAWANRLAGDSLPSGLVLRLPSEAEWEKAARGPDGRLLPWGNTFDPDRCNTNESEVVATVPVERYSPAADSLYGAAGMTGNTWEWTLTLWGEDRSNASYVYPYRADDGREDLHAGEACYRIIRGVSFKDRPQDMRIACRDLDPPNWSLNNLGFRLFAAPPR